MSNVSNARPSSTAWRWRALAVCYLFAVCVVIGRLAQLQIFHHQDYVAEAAGQRQVSSTISAKRGEVYATERDANGQSRRVPLAVNRPTYLVFADTRNIEKIPAVAHALAEPLGVKEEDLVTLLNQENDPYVPLQKRVTKEVADQIRGLKLAGIGFEESAERFYPNNEVSSHIIGFVRYDEENLKGQYGIEGTLDDLLAGRSGSLRSERSAGGAWIALTDRLFAPAEDGADVVLTIDWTIQYKVCRALDAWVAQHGADSGSVVVLDPKTGAILAMCGAPSFNPNTYNEIKDIRRFSNPATLLNYEPGSIMKPITMAAAIDQQKVSPSTTYTDTGEIRIASYTIRNSDLKAHGVQTMTQVLEESLNTGAIFAMRQIGAKTFLDYLEKFGFGAKTGIEQAEATGDISRLKDSNEIYAVTGSFGQGLTTTPLQMVSAYGALANGGKLMKPYLVREIVKADGEREEEKPIEVRQVVSERTATLIGGMLTQVVEQGHGQKAGVPGYYIAGKTGTAQIPKANGGGYESGATIGSFVGFGPVENPRFAMIVRVDRPRDVQFAESSAAPLFGDIAKFILQYYEVPPTRK